MMCTNLSQLQEYLRDAMQKLSVALSEQREEMFDKPLEQWAYQLSWGDKFFANTARYAVLQELHSNLTAAKAGEAVRTDEELLKNVADWLKREVMTRARLPESSSSESKNMMARHALTAYAELLAVIAIPETAA